MAKALSRRLGCAGARGSGFPNARWSATPPRAGSETFLAAALPRFPPRVPSQWERRLGGGKGKASRRSRPAFAGLERRPSPETQRERHTDRDSRAGDGVSEPVPGWREQACGTLHGRGLRLQSWGHDPLSLPLSDCNHGDEGAKGPALRPLIFFASPLPRSLASSDSGAVHRGTFRPVLPQKPLWG